MDLGDFLLEVFLKHFLYISRWVDIRVGHASTATRHDLVEGADFAVLKLELRIHFDCFVADWLRVVNFKSLKGLFLVPRVFHL